MEAIILLCDFAEEVNGKLYIMGGGWSRLPAMQPQVIALAIRVLVPWDQANRPHKIVVELVTQDGEPADDETAGMSLRLEANLEVGRPPGLRPGSALEAPLAFRFSAQFKPGAYRFDFSIDGSLITTASFEAVGDGSDS